MVLSEAMRILCAIIVIAITGLAGPLLAVECTSDKIFLDSLVSQDSTVQKKLEALAETNSLSEADLLAVATFRAELVPNQIGSIDNPGVLSEKRAKGLYQSLLEALPEAQMLVSLSPESTLSQDQKLIVAKYGAVLRYLADVARVLLWVANECPDSWIYDFRPWLDLQKDSKNLKLMMEQWASLSKDQKQAIAKKIFDAGGLSYQNLNSQDITDKKHSLLSKISISLDENAALITDLFQEVLDAGQSVYDAATKVVMGRSPKATTEIVDGLLVVKFRFKTNSPSESDFIKETVESRWSSDKLKIELILTDLSDESAIEISYLDTNKPPHASWEKGRVEIPKSRLLRADRGAGTLAHEFGHILGFLDCYAEFWDQEKQELVSYSLHENIMCDSRKPVSPELAIEVFSAYSL
jgi:hypothetical protein